MSEYNEVHDKNTVQESVNFTAQYPYEHQSIYQGAVLDYIY